jgi:hypothetical protein
MEKEALLDVSMEILNKGRVLDPGAELSLKISAFNFGDRRADIGLKYVIMDEMGVILSSQTESLAVETQASFIRNLPLPHGIEPGRYLISVTAGYGDDFASASDAFWVLGEGAEGTGDLFEILRQLLPAIMILAVAVCIFVPVFMKRDEISGWLSRPQEGPKKGKPAEKKAVKKAIVKKKPPHVKEKKEIVDELAKKEAAKPKAPPAVPEIADIKGIMDGAEAMLGKDVTVKGNMWLTNSFTIGNHTAYWYTIADDSGKIVLSSDKKLPEGKKSVRGKLERTKTGRLHIRFKGFKRTK